MNIEISLLKALLDYDNYKKYYNLVNLKAIRETSKELYNVFELLSKVVSDLQRSISIEEFCNFVVQQYSERQYGVILEQVRGNASRNDVCEWLLRKHAEREYYNRLAVTAYEVGEGRGSPEQLQDLTAQYKSILEGTNSGVREESVGVTDNLDELLDQQFQKPGLRWPLMCLNKSLGSLRRGDFGFAFARPECFAKGTEVLLSDGRAINIEKIIPGMQVLGPDSQPRHVVACSRGKEKMYRVSYSWGDSYVCNESHVLQLRAEGATTTQVKVKDYLKWSNKLKHRFKQYKVGIELPERKVRLDPYILGLWLGDGTSSSPQFTNADPEIINYIAEWAERNQLKVNVFEREGQGKAKTISVCGLTKRRGANTFSQWLKSSRLINNKHIPDSYLRNSRTVRMDLLAGLIDTDGWKEKSSYGFCNKNEILIDQVVWLARSLGLHCTKKAKIVHGETYYVLGIYGACYEIPCKISRKKVLQPLVKPKRNGLNFGFTITEEPNETEYFGIQVDGDSLYLLKDFTVVHNTGKTTFLAHTSSHMAQQFESDEQYVLWFNNEEDSGKVKIRTYQADLGWTLEEINKNRDKAKESITTAKRIKLINAVGMDKPAIEAILEKHKQQVRLIIFDQIDKIPGFKADREDLMLGSIYQWAREIAKTYAPVIGVCQADGTGEGVKWLTMGNVANAKTSKQAEADWILGIGKIPDPGFENVRFLNISKNKLLGDQDTEPSLRHAHFEVMIRPEIARYEDIKTWA